MASRFIEKKGDVDLEQIISELKTLEGKKIIIGPAAAENSSLATYAASNEFGAVIKAKKGFLAIPCHPAAKGKRPGDFSGLNFVPGKHPGYGFLVLSSKGAKGTRKFEPYFILKKFVRIPERSWLRGTFDLPETIDKAEDTFKQMLNRIVAGTAGWKEAADAIGLTLVACVKKRIASNIGPENAALTQKLKRKGSNTLIDEGQMLKSISHEVI